MTYEQIITKVRQKYKDADTSEFNCIQAIQINLIGKNTQGVFYIEIKDSKVNVEPYDYHDNQAVLTVAPTNLLKILNGKLDLMSACSSGKAEISGNTDTVLKIIEQAK